MLLIYYLIVPRERRENCRMVLIKATQINLPRRERISRILDCAAGGE
jgi:hypothetical protein